MAGKLLFSSDSLTIHLLCSLLIDNRQTSYDNNTHQIWLIADAGRGQVLILNQGTGTFITAPQSTYLIAFFAAYNYFSSCNRITFLKILSNSYIQIRSATRGCKPYPQHTCLCRWRPRRTKRSLQALDRAATKQWQRCIFERSLSRQSA
jgi:hypothetical protein